MERKKREREEDVAFSCLVGETFKWIDKSVEGDMIIFTCTDGTVYEMRHDQDCCESVSIDDIVGNLNDLIGYPILKAEESTSGDYAEYNHETWTFYHLATVKGYVDIKWYGESNGYYSESVNFYIKP